jgi:hypothetical protein
MQWNTIRRLSAHAATWGCVMALSSAVFTQSQSNETSLPPAVKKAFDQAYPGAAISSTEQKRDNNRTIFRVDSVDKGRRRVLLYESGGAVIEVGEQLDDKDLPPAVASAMHSHPRAVYVSGMKVTRGGSVEYHLTLRGTRKTSMVTKPDGTVISFK